MVIKKERLIRLSVRVSPKAAETINHLQDYLGESQSSYCKVSKSIDLYT